MVGKALLALALLSAPLAARAEPVVTTALDVSTPLVPGEYLWDVDGVPAGRLQIVVDLARGQLYVYRRGIEIGRTLILWGSDAKPTPTGRFKILEKDADHISNIYHLPMPYMLRLTWGGVAIHGSGAIVDGEVYATHGCIGVPDEFAALLFAQARLGDEVTVTRHWMPSIYGR